MRLLRGIAGALLWIVGALLGLIGLILCATVLLLPVGLAILGYARRLFTFSLKLMAPRAVKRAAKDRGKGKAGKLKTGSRRDQSSS